MDYPTGNEEGKYLVLDLGGTNIRVYSIELTGEKSGFKIDQVQHKLPNELKTGNADQLWDFVTEILESFLKKAGFDLSVTTDLSFIFSFPTTQRTIDEGILQRWTKGFNIAGCEGQDTAAALRKAIAKRVSHLPSQSNSTTHTTSESPAQSQRCNK
jgi:hexokinase